MSSFEFSVPQTHGPLEQPLQIAPPKQRSNHDVGHLKGYPRTILGSKQCLKKVSWRQWAQSSLSMMTKAMAHAVVVLPQDTSQHEGGPKSVPQPGLPRCVCLQVLEGTTRASEPRPYIEIKPCLIICGHFCSKINLQSGHFSCSV